MKVLKTEDAAQVSGGAGSPLTQTVLPVGQLSAPLHLLEHTMPPVFTMPMPHWPAGTPGVNGMRNPVVESCPVAPAAAQDLS
jgi:hypothetical protein